MKTHGFVGSAPHLIQIKIDIVYNAINPYTTTSISTCICLQRGTTLSTKTSTLPFIAKISRSPLTPILPPRNNMLTQIGLRIFSSSEAFFISYSYCIISYFLNYFLFLFYSIFKNNITSYFFNTPEDFIFLKYHFFSIKKMEPNQTLVRIDQCLRSYFQHHNNKNKRSITSVLVKRKTLDLFYVDMINDNKQKHSFNHDKHPFYARDARMQREKENLKKKPLQMYSTKKKINSMDEKMAICVKHDTRKWAKADLREGQGLIDEEEIQQFKRIEQEKYINRWRSKSKVSRITRDDKSHNPSQHKTSEIQTDSQHPKTPSKKLDQLYYNYFQNNAEKQQFNGAKEKVFKKIRERKFLYQKMKKRFEKKVYKKKGYHPF